VFKLTSPVPLSPLKSKSLAESKVSTYEVVAIFVELSPAVCVIAVELSGKLTPVESKDNVND